MDHKYVMSCTQGSYEYKVVRDTARALYKESKGGAKRAVRAARPSGTIVEEILYRSVDEPPSVDGLSLRPLQIPLVANGEVVGALPTLEDGRTHLADALVSLPWEGLGLSHGDPAVPTRYVLG